MKLDTCEGCRDREGCQFGVRSIWLVDADRAAAELVCPPSFAGGPGVAHGGWTAAVLDEVIGRDFSLRGRLAVTATLTVAYRKPVPVGPPLDIRVIAGQRTGGRREMGAELRLQATSAVLAVASGVWVERDEHHFARHRQWLRDELSASQDQNGPA